MQQIDYASYNKLQAQKREAEEAKHELLHRQKLAQQEADRTTFQILEQQRIDNEIVEQRDQDLKRRLEAAEMMKKRAEELERNSLNRIQQQHHYQAQQQEQQKKAYQGGYHQQQNHQQLYLASMPSYQADTAGFRY